MVTATCVTVTGWSKGVATSHQGPCSLLVCVQLEPSQFAFVFPSRAREGWPLCSVELCDAVAVDMLNRTSCIGGGGGGGECGGVEFGEGSPR